VTYSVAGFVEKNTDLLDKDLSCVMFQAEHPFLRTLFPEGESGLEKVMLGSYAQCTAHASWKINL
jgi:myosin heavy subunit